MSKYHNFCSQFFQNPKPLDPISNLASTTSLESEYSILNPLCQKTPYLRSFVLLPSTSVFLMWCHCSVYRVSKSPCWPDRTAKCRAVRLDVSRRARSDLGASKAATSCQQFLAARCSAVKPSSVCASISDPACKVH